MRCFTETLVHFLINFLHSHFEEEYFLDSHFNNSNFPYISMILLM